MIFCLLIIFSRSVQALQAPACHENIIKFSGYILGEFGNLIAGDPRSRYIMNIKIMINCSF